MTSVFSSEDSVGRSIDFVPREATEENVLTEVYEFDRCATWVKENGYTRVALQFPDERLKDSIPVQKCLQAAFPDGVQSFILGDTSYGSCCVDEVAAEHYSADSIIHYGSACLSPTQRLPVLYCFCPQAVNISHVSSQVRELVSDCNTRFILMADTMYQHAVEQVADELQSMYSAVVRSSLQIPPTVTKVISLSEEQPDQTTPDASLTNPLDANAPESENCNEGKCDDEGNGNSSGVCTYCKCNRHFSLPQGSNLEDCTVLYFGEEGRLLTNLMMTMNKCPFVTYDPEKRSARRETLNVSRELMKRYYMIERAKDANIVGIVAGTLGVSRTKEMIAHLKQLVKDAGKKSYTLAVGKLNVAKLANFMEVDVFVLVACPQNSLIDSKDFIKPVVTPFEMEIACNQAREWTGDYVTDFLQLLPGAAEYVLAVPAVQDTADVSLISNRLRSLGQKSEVEVSSVVMLRSDALAVATVDGGSRDAAEYLASRTWKGLESGEGDSTPVAILKPGRVGLPTQYDDEPET